MTKISRKFKEIIYKTWGVEKVHFIHLGKTGGTSIKEALFKFPQDNFSKFKYRKIIFHHPHEITLKDIPEGEKFFFSVRDPIQRFLSAFHAAKRQDIPRYKSPWSEGEKQAFSIFESPNNLAKNLSSPKAELREKAEVAMKSIRHIKTSYWFWFYNEAYFLNRKDDLLMVLQQETLKEDFAKFKTKIGLPKEVCLPVDKAIAHSGHSDEDRSLEEISIQNLKKWYARDYDFLEFLRSNNLIKNL